MNKSYYFEGKFDDENLREFIEFINSNAESDINIYLNSPGGFYHVFEALLEIINSEPIRFSIVVTGTAMSAAFLLLLYTKCDKKITASSFGMHHQSSQEFSMMANGKPQWQCDEYRQTRLKWYLDRDKAINKKLGLDKKQLKRFNNGDEIFFTAEQLREFIKLDWNYDS